MVKAVGVIALTLVALVIGAFGIVVFIGVGEALNNGIAAFAAVSIPFALLAAFLSWLSPRAQCLWRWPWPPLSPSSVSAERGWGPSMYLGRSGRSSAPSAEPAWARK